MNHDIKETTNSFIQALESKNIDGVAKTLADDVHFEDVPMGVHKGKIKALEKVADFFSKAASLRWDNHRIIHQDNVVVIERTSHITLNGKSMVLPMVLILEFNASGLIQVFKDYFDLKTLESQLA
jgi:limonene-1,2-epoxide hydrolase